MSQNVMLTAFLLFTIENQGDCATYTTVLSGIVVFLGSFASTFFKLITESYYAKLVSDRVNLTDV